MLSTSYDILYESGLYNIYGFREVLFFDQLFYESFLVRSFRSERDAINYLNLLI